MMAHVYSSLQLQFFVVQAVNYSVIIIKKVQKPTISQIESAFHGAS